MKPPGLHVLTPGSALDKIVASLSDLKARLDSRTKVTPAAFADYMKLREETHHLGARSYLPERLFSSWLKQNRLSNSLCSRFTSLAMSLISLKFSSLGEC